MTETDQEVLSVIYSLLPDFATNLRKWILFVATGQNNYAPSDEEICRLLKKNWVAEEVLPVIRSIPSSWVKQHTPPKKLAPRTLTVKEQKSQPSRP